MVWLGSVRGWCGTSCPVLENAVVDLWHALEPLDVMLLRVLGDWIHARVVWQGREEFLTNAPRRLPNLWKQKTIIQISTFPLSAGELGWRPVVPVLLGDGPDDVLVHSAAALSCSDSEIAPSKPFKFCKHLASCKKFGHEFLML